MLRHCNRIRRQQGNLYISDIEEGEGYSRRAGHARVRARRARSHARPHVESNENGRGGLGDLP